MFFFARLDVNCVENATELGTLYCYQSKIKCKARQNQDVYKSFGFTIVKSNLNSKHLEIIIQFENRELNWPKHTLTV